jgi:hypothetical protein
VGDGDIGPLGPAADDVGLPHGAGLEHPGQGADMILYVQPVADLAARAVDGKMVAGEALDDHQGDQLFGEVVGAVVVRAVGHQHRQAVGVVPSADQMVGRRLRRRIGRARIVGRGLGEEAGLAQRSEHLVGGDVVKAEPALRLVVETPPVFEGRRQHDRGPDHVGVDEGRRSVDGAVDVGLGRQVGDHVRAIVAQSLRHRFAIADIHPAEAVALPVVDGAQRREVARIG